MNSDDFRDMYGIENPIEQSHTTGRSKTKVDSVGSGSDVDSEENFETKEDADVLIEKIKDCEFNKVFVVTKHIEKDVQGILESVAEGTQITNL